MRESWKITSLLIIAVVVLSFIAYHNSSPRGGITQNAPQVSGIIATISPSCAPSPSASGARGAVQAPGLVSEHDKRVAAAIAKYGNRPVVMDLMEDLKNDPCTAKAIADRRLSNMFDALSAAREAGCLDKLKLKYVFRPEFIKLMAEVMSDPEVRPLLEPGWGAGPAAGNQPGAR